MLGLKGDHMTTFPSSLCVVVSFSLIGLCPPPKTTLTDNSKIYVSHSPGREDLTFTLSVLIQKSGET